jgi:glycosyltransferase involved in cell wall biosynthesis
MGNVKNMKAVSVLMVSTEYPPMSGGVGRYTKNLTNALRKSAEGETVRVYVVCNENGDGDFSGLYATNEENSNILLKIVEELRPDLVHVQYEPGLYGIKMSMINPKVLSTNIDKFYEICETPIVTTFHSAYPLEQWMRLAPHIPLSSSKSKNLLSVPINRSKQMLEYWKHFINYKSFCISNGRKLLKSRANIVFSNYLARLLLLSVFNDTKNNYDDVDAQDCNVKVIYHGSEPYILPYRISKEKARSIYSLPTDEKRKIALALGFVTTTKGWDLFKKMLIPENWSIVVSHAKNYYSREPPSPSTLSRLHGSFATDKRLIELNHGFLSDEHLTILFYAADAVILPYTVASGSGVMFDSLAHGLPFIASDLGFFKEFAKKGLGIVVKRKSVEFSKALKELENNYSSYRERVEQFKKASLTWDYTAKQHVELYFNILIGTDTNEKEKGIVSSRE